MDKKILAGMLSGIMMLGSVPVLAAMQKEEPHHIHQQMSQSADKQQQDDGVQRIHQQVSQSTSSHQEPPKDENGNPLPPPDDGNRPPEPPKDENGNSLPPPDGSRPPEPPRDENGNPLPPPDGFRHGQQSEE